MRKVISFLFAVLIILFNFFPVYADDSMEATEYKIEVVAYSNNSFDYTENITIDYFSPHHGIFRYIPLRGTEISNISVEGEQYELSEKYSGSGQNRNKYQVIKIGDPYETITGSKSYTIKYKLSLWRDNDATTDMLIANVLPTNWDTNIKNFSCSLEMPKNTDFSKLEIFSGKYGSETNADNIEYYTENNTIYLETEKLPANHGVTIYLPLPDGYWTDAPEFGDSSTSGIICFILGPILSFLLWLWAGRDEHMTKTLEFYPPSELTPGEIGFLIDEKVDNKDITANIIYMADKGYVRINDNDKDYEIYPLKRPKGEPKYIQTLYDGIGSFDLNFSQKYLRAKEELKNSYENRIYNEDGDVNRTICRFLTVIPAFILYLWNHAYSDGGAGALILAIVLTLIGISFLNKAVDKRYGDSKKKTTLRILIAFGCLILSTISLLKFQSISLLSVNKMIIIMLLYFVLTGCSMLATAFIKTRKPAQTRLMGRILGFKEFIKTAELDKINTLINDDPEYFYHIIPYAYVFGLTDAWIKKFENIPLIQPSWCPDSYDPRRPIFWHDFDHYMGREFSRIHTENMIGKTVDVIDNAISEFNSVSDGHDGSWSGGGGFSGGGFSGGGFGGGGGGGW